MEALHKIALAIFALSLGTFIALFGRLPALRHTPIGFLHRALLIHIPKLMHNIDDKVTGGVICSSTSRLGHYLLHEKHPVVLVKPFLALQLILVNSCQIFFLALLTVSTCLFLSSAWSRLTLFHHMFIAVLLPAPYVFTYLCARSSSSQVTSSCHAYHMSLYPYDHILYHPNRMCTTCKHLKPARSKHCSTCRVCIAKHDHHCMWVNNCIGRENYRWFLALLTSLGCLLTYGVRLAYLLLGEHVASLQHGNGTGTAPSLMVRFMSSLDRWGTAIMIDKNVGTVGLLAMLTAPLAWGLLVYHVYLVWAGTTTNETSKWTDLREAMAHGVVFKARRGLVTRSYRDQNSSGRLDMTPETRWPIESDWIVVETENGEPPRFGGMHDTYSGSDITAWERCWKLAELENIYDLGFWDNLLDVLRVE